MLDKILHFLTGVSGKAGLPGVCVYTCQTDSLCAAGWPLALAFRGSLFITAVFGQFVFIAGPVFIVCLSAEHVLLLITAGVFLL